MDADDARRMLLLVPKFIELPPHSRAVEALSLKGAFQENFPYLFPQNDVSLAGNNIDFLGVCEVEGPIEASSNDPREAFGLVRSEVRRVGNACVSTYSSRGSTNHKQQKKQTKQT